MDPETLTESQSTLSNKRHSTYIYKPLETPTTIRILRLEPGRGDVPLAGEILHTDLSDVAKATESLDHNWSIYHADFPSSLLNYHALSYVWGEPLFNESLTIAETSISITTSLSVALHRVRKTRSPMYIWIDAICINQNDHCERGHQVGLMGQVYAHARLVLIWLGPDKGKAAPDVFSSIKGKGPYDHGPAIRKLIHLPWFSRLWVVQELSLAQRALFVWGDKYLNHLYVLRAAKSLDRTYWISATLRYQLENDAGFLTALQTTRNLRCVDGRDHIFGLLGLVPYAHGDEPIITALQVYKPEYSKSVERVYLDIARIFVENDRAADLLSLVAHDSDQSPSLPTWVPDWRIPKEIGNFGYFEDRRWVAPFKTAFDEMSWTLSFSGILLSTVSMVMRMPLDEKAWPASFDAMESFWSCLVYHQEGSSFEISRMGQKFRELLFGDSTPAEPCLVLSDLRLETSLKGHFEDVVAHINKTPSVLRMIEVWAGAEHPGMCSFLDLDAVKGGRLFQTDKGGLGLGAPNVQPGDQLVLLAGNPPFIAVLRENTDDYAFVGAANLAGLISLDSFDKCSTTATKMWSERMSDVREFRLR